MDLLLYMTIILSAIALVSSCDREVTPPSNIYTCQMGFARFEGDEISQDQQYATQYIRALQFNSPFQEAPRTHVGVASAGAVNEGTDSSIAFKVEANRATKTHISLSARSSTPSKGAYIVIRWIACGMMSATEGSHWA